MVLGIVAAVTAATAAVAVASGDLPPVPGIGGGETDLSPAEAAFGSLQDSVDEVRGTRPILVAEGPDSFCLEAADGGGCGSLETLLAGELHIFDYCGTLPAGRTRVAGAMVDGVDSVQVIPEDGGPVVTAPVETNIYDTQVEGVAATVKWTQSGVNRTLEILRPSDLSLSNCLPVSKFEESDAPDAVQDINDLRG